jgi:hypothetical protein
VFISALSILASLGICGIFSLKMTLIISVAIPFLVLSLSLDNVFVMVDAYELTDPSIAVSFRY